jgi:hypothetical protein
VRKIQNNVRGWLMRKNYINLREAAKFLQLSWRERKKIVANSNSTKYIPAANKSEMPHNISNNSLHHSVIYNHVLQPPGGNINTNNDVETIAAARLQAYTRGMLARKSFTRIRRKTIASLVIQKSLVKWWAHNKTK